jgi:L-alanine-DL-glutamate epimerase-like enolase superfamily enzyme
VIRCDTRIERWELIEPFATARDSITHIPVLVARLEDAAGRVGRAEAAGVDYDGETPESMAAEIAALGTALPESLDGDALRALLPAGGARNALDCALWDLRAKQTGVPAAERAGLAPLRAVTTVLTLGLADEADTRRKARAATAYPILKLKLDAERHVDVVRIVREEHPRARLIVDANQAWTRAQLERLLPPLAALDVELIEQPLARGDDAALDGLRPDVPLAADESCTDARSLAGLVGRYRYANVKLDKCGGLTEALAMVRQAGSLGLGLMVGNMCGTSLAMAPGFLVAQSCDYVDLDGPLLQRLDRDPPIRFEAGRMEPPDRRLWG